MPTRKASELHIDDGIDVRGVRLRCNRCQRPLREKRGVSPFGEALLLYTYACPDCANTAVLIVPISDRATPGRDALTV